MRLARGAATIFILVTRMVPENESGKKEIAALECGRPRSPQRTKSRKFKQKGKRNRSTPERFSPNYSGRRVCRLCREGDAVRGDGRRLFSASHRISSIARESAARGTGLWSGLVVREF